MFWSGILGFELRKIFSKRNVLILIGGIIVLILFCWNGISDYKLILDSKKPFQETERKKVSRHIHYTFYGVRGVRLLYIPSSLSVIFNDSAVFPDMTAHVDTSEKLEISNSFKGKDLFSVSGSFMDFSGIMLLIGAFLALTYGWGGTRKEGYLKFISDLSGCRQPGFFITLARIIILNLVFWILCAIALIFIIFSGLNPINVYFFVYVLVLTIVITFLVVIGAVIGTLKKDTTQLIILPVIYFLLVLFIPWVILEGVYMEAKANLQSVYDFENKMFIMVMNFEKYGYERFGVWKSGKPAPDDIKAMIKNDLPVMVYEKIKKLENERVNNILSRIHTYQNISAIFPTSFYFSSNKELSSKGFQNFVDFYHYAFEMKFKFIDFYLDRKYNRALPKGGVEPFIKGDEDLFYGESQLPKNFLLGIILNLIYIVVLMTILYIRQDKLVVLNEKKSIELKIDYKKGNSIFMLCRTELVKNSIFRSLKRKVHVACLDKLTVNFQFNNISVGTLLKYFSKLAKVDEESAKEYLKVLGITDINRKSNLSSEDILKLYAVIKISHEDVKEMIFNDFFKQRSREFESDFFKLLRILEASGKKVVYLSCEMFYPRYKANGKLKEEFETESFPIDYEKITLR